MTFFLVTGLGITIIAVMAIWRYYSMVAINKDLVETKNKLRQSEAFSNTIIETEPECVKIVDADGNLLMMNRAGLDMIEAESLEQVKGKCVCPLVTSEYRDAFMRLTKEVCNGGSGTLTFEMVGLKGRRLWLETHAVPFRNEKSEILGLLGITRDITEKIKAEKVLRESQQRLNLHVQNTPLGVIEWTLDLRVKEWNPAAEKIFGYSRQEAVGKYPGELVLPPSEKEHVDKIWSDIISRKGGAHNVIENHAKDGKILICEWFNTPLVNEGGQVIGAASLVLDVTQQRRAADLLANERERLAVTLGSIGDGVIVTDTEGRITLLNKVGEELTGWKHEEAMGKPLAEVFNIINETTREQCENPAEKVVRTGLTVGLANHTALIRKDGTEIVIADSGAPIRDRESKTIGVVLVFRDITAQYRLEQELQKMEKLESLGILAGGLAHDFNNLLTSIMGNVSLAKMFIGIDHKAFERLTEAEKAAQRATDLTHQLLTFAKGGAPVKKAALITGIAKEAVNFALSGSNVKCFYNIPANLWSTEVDKGQINQVFNNLIINAIHAMPEGGSVHIGFENYTVSGGEVPSLEPGDYVRITFRDEGVGIPDEHLGRIFDPYFTTKATGSGLGLSSVFSILKRHEGHISVKSAAGAGTAFTIYIPALKDTACPGCQETAGVRHGKGKILIMDDEALIRNVAGAILAALGYEIGFAGDGNEAIFLYMNAQKENRPFDLVIMDLTIPGGMGGKEAVTKLHELAPHAKVLVSSGYSVDPVMSEYGKYGFCGVINKPYNTNQVSEIISKVLAS